MVELRVPARQDMLLVVRMALSGVCAKCGLGIEAVENIRIAADEACFCLMHQPQPVDYLNMRCTWDAQCMVVHLDANRMDVSPCAAAAHDPELARCILATLVPQVEMRHDDWGVFGIDLVIQLGCA